METNIKVRCCFHEVSKGLLRKPLIRSFVVKECAKSIAGFRDNDIKTSRHTVVILFGWHFLALIMTFEASAKNGGSRNGRLFFVLGDGNLLSRFLISLFIGNFCKRKKRK